MAIADALAQRGREGPEELVVVFWSAQYACTPVDRIDVSPLLAKVKARNVYMFLAVRAVGVLGTLPQAADQSVPAMVAAMDNEPSLRLVIVQALGNLGPKAAAAVPALEALQAANKDQPRRELTLALSKALATIRAGAPQATTRPAESTDSVP
jgi:predicted Zn-dependent protease